MPKAAEIKLSKEDIARAEQMKAYPWFKDAKWQREIQGIVDNGFKMEVDSLLTKSISFITERVHPEEAPGPGLPELGARRTPFVRANPGPVRTSEMLHFAPVGPPGRADCPNAGRAGLCHAVACVRGWPDCRRLAIRRTTDAHVFLTWTLRARVRRRASYHLAIQR